MSDLPFLLYIFNELIYVLLLLLFLIGDTAIFLYAPSLSNVLFKSTL